MRDFGPSVLWGELEQEMERNGQGSLFHRQVYIRARACRWHLPALLQSTSHTVCHSYGTRPYPCIRACTKADATKHVKQTKEAHWMDARTTLHLHTR